MAFDLGRRFEPTPPMSVPPEKRTAQDVLDFILRAIVLLPLLGLYTWWIASTIWRGLSLMFGAG